MAGPTAARPDSREAPLLWRVTAEVVSDNLGGPMVLSDEERTAAEALLGPRSAEALRAGHAAVLTAAFAGRVPHVLSADRAGTYLTLLYGLLLLRRGHELEPLHDDLFREVEPGLTVLEADYSADSFAHDLQMLEQWGCVARRTEALKIRGYKDIRRERFRYRLSDGAVAMLEWLEGRLAARLEGRVIDSRDLLTDVLGQLRELKRVLDRYRKDERTDEVARRAVYLLTAVDEAAHALTEELLTFRGTMLAFIGQGYDVAALREILGWLERYVSVYLRRIEELRTDIDARLSTLEKPRYRVALVECRALLAAERAQTPSGLRGPGTLRDTNDLLDAQRPFFAEAGRLSELCARIDGSGLEVLRKMHRHLRELERRSARLAELRAVIRRAAELDEARTPELARFVGRLVASGHGHFARRRPPADARERPPMPRGKTAATPTRERRRPLRKKRGSPEEARALRAALLQALGAWIDDELLGGRDEGVLSELRPTAKDAPRRWLDVARARHLARGRPLARLGLTIEARKGRAELGDDEVGLDAPDCLVRRQGSEP